MAHSVDISYSGTPMSALFGGCNEAGELVSVRAIIPVAVWLTHTQTHQLAPGAALSAASRDHSVTRVIGMVPYRSGLQDAKQITDFITFVPTDMSGVPVAGLRDYLQRLKPVE